MSTTDFDHDKRAADNSYVSLLLRQMNELRATHPQQMSFIDSLDLDTCSRVQMVEAMRQAPSDILRYFILGKFMFRMALAQVTQRPFN